MLSLIICSRTKDLPLSLKENIESTIGAEYELVVIDNSKNQYSIFSAYNEGVRRSKGDLLCFMHDDIMYDAVGWGNNVVRHFDDPNTGLIGVFGGHYLPDTVCHVFDSELFSWNFRQIVGEGIEDRMSKSHFGNAGEVEAVAVDGIWFVVRKQLFDKISFDERYRGFHYYDMDICMQVWANGYKCKTVDDIHLTHVSNGGYNDDFVFNSYRFYEKWKSCLPMKKGLFYDEETYHVAGMLCQFRRYSRELELENQKLRVLGKSPLLKTMKRLDRIKNKFHKAWKRIFPK